MTKLIITVGTAIPLLAVAAIVFITTAPYGRCVSATAHIGMPVDRQSYVCRHLATA